MPDRDSRNDKSLQVALFAALAFNPVVLFILLDSAIVALALSALAIAALIASYRRYGFGLPTAYAINVAALLGIFVHAELLVRVRFQDYVMEDLYRIEDGYYFNRPNLTKQLDDKEYSAAYLTNRDGFRIGHSQQTDVTFGTVDWLFVGDSYTQGAQVQFEELYTTLLYRTFPDRIVANAGVSGWGIPEEAAFLSRALDRHKPSLVFLQVSSFNDFMKVAARKAGLTDHLMQRSAFVRLLLQGIKYENPASLPLGRWTEPFYPDTLSNRRFNIFYRPTSPEKERDLAAYSSYLRTVAANVRQHGAKLVVILLPTKEQIHFPHLEEVVESFRIDPRDLDLDRPQNFLKALADSLVIDFVDARAAFEATPVEPFFEYDEHLNAHGHRVLADLLETYLEDAGAWRKSRILSPEYDGDRYPSYSSDGRYLTFQSPRDGNSELFRTDRSFESLTRLTYNDADEGHATSAPDGKLAFTEGDPATHRTRVAISRSDGSGRRYVTDGVRTFGAIPAFSIDGAKLAYAAWSVDSLGRMTTPRIAMVNVTGEGSQFITDGREEAWRPVFSPNGRQIAFIMKDRGQFDIFLHDLPSGNTRRVTSTPYDEWDPSFAPDGRSLVCAARAAGNWDLVRIDLQSFHRTELTKTHGDEWDPVFSPSGDSITYAGDFGIFRGIYRMSAYPVLPKPRR